MGKVTIVFSVVALILSAILAVAIGRAGWLKTFTPIVELVGTGVVWVADIPRWSVRVLGSMELLAAAVIFAAPVLSLILGDLPVLSVLGVGAALAVALLMAAAHIFHRARGESAHTWTTHLAFATLAIMTAAAQFVSL